MLFHPPKMKYKHGSKNPFLLSFLTIKHSRLKKIMSLDIWVLKMNIYKGGTNVLTIHSTSNEPKMKLSIINVLTLSWELPVRDDFQWTVLSERYKQSEYLSSQSEYLSSQSEYLGCSVVCLVALTGFLIRGSVVKPWTNNT